MFHTEKMPNICKSINPFNQSILSFLSRWGHTNSVQSLTRPQPSFNRGRQDPDGCYSAVKLEGLKHFGFLLKGHSLNASSSLWQSINPCISAVFEDCTGNVFRTTIWIDFLVFYNPVPMIFCFIHSHSRLADFKSLKKIKAFDVSMMLALMHVTAGGNNHYFISL